MKGGLVLFQIDGGDPAQCFRKYAGVPQDFCHCFHDSLRSDPLSASDSQGNGAWDQVEGIRPVRFIPPVRDDDIGFSAFFRQTDTGAVFCRCRFLRPLDLPAPVLCGSRFSRPTMFRWPGSPSQIRWSGRIIGIKGIIGINGINRISTIEIIIDSDSLSGQQAGGNLFGQSPVGDLQAAFHCKDIDRKEAAAVGRGGDYGSRPEGVRQDPAQTVGTARMPGQEGDHKPAVFIHRQHRGVCKLVPHEGRNAAHGNAGRG